MAIWRYCKVWLGTRRVSLSRSLLYFCHAIGNFLKLFVKSISGLTARLVFPEWLLFPQVPVPSVIFHLLLFRGKAIVSLSATV